MNKVELYNGDCYDILPQLIDKGIKVDLILTDPPYIVSESGGECGAFGKRAKRLRKEIDFTANGFDYESIFSMFKQICKIPNYIIFCSNQQLGDFKYFFEHSENLTVETLIWKKTNPMPIANNHHLSDVEYILYVKDKGTYFNKDLPMKMKSKVAEFPIVASSHKMHPTQKPLKLIEQYVLLHSKKDDVILDCFMGSGTTGVSAVRHNRNFIGIEKEQKYYNIAKQRISAENNQTKLF